MIQHFLLVRTSPLGPAKIILERFMGPTWKESVTSSSSTSTAFSNSTYYSDDVSDLVDSAVDPMYDDNFLSDNTTNTNSLRTPTNNDHLTLERQEKWRQLVLKLTAPSWKDVVKGNTHVIAVKDKYISSLGINDLIFMITGTDNDDEMGLHTILVELVQVVRETCGKADGEKVIKNFGKMCLIIDAMFDENQGSCLSLEKSHIMHQTKLKKPVV
jgi:hypothetical protein